MTLNLRLEYRTAYGEELYVVVCSGREKAYPMQYIGDALWGATLKVTTTKELK